MNHIVQLAKKKASQSSCVYKVSAIGLDKRGNVIYKSTNKHRFMKKGGGLHAEMEVMKKAGPSLRTIVLCRVGRSGEIRPIDPCPSCAAKAKELSIKILTIRSTDVPR